MMNRREFIKVSAVASLSSLAGGCRPSVRWDRDAYRKTAISRVAILEAKSYQAPLEEIIRRGIHLFKLDLKGKRIVLKPNLVEFDPKGVINTDPAVIEAAIGSFRSLGAREVVVAEGPGHRRDSEYLLAASGIYDVINEHRVRYVDLNTDDVRRTKLRSSFTNLRELYLPETLFNAGVVPGSVYGWPKNALHWAGIHGSILDINSSLPIPQFAIVDGVVGMEGNGPLQGQAKQSGVLILGDDLVAVDAIAARLMTIEPRKIEYLEIAGRFLGNISHERIELVGERLERFQQNYRVIEDFQSLKVLTG